MMGHGGGGGGRFMESDDLQKKVVDSKIYKALLQYIRPYWKYVLLSFALLVCVAGLELLIPIITMNAIDEYIVSDLGLVVFDSDDAYKAFTRLPAADKVEVFHHDGHYLALLPTRIKKEFSRSWLSRNPRKVLLATTQQTADSLADFYNIPRVAIRHSESQFRIPIPYQVMAKLTDGELEVLDKSGILADARFIVACSTDAVKQRLGEIPFYTLDEERIVFMMSDLDHQYRLGKITRDDLSVIREYSERHLRWYGLLFFLAIILKFGFDYSQVFVVNYAAQHAMYDLRRDLFSHMQRMPMRFFDRNPVGRLVTRVTNDIRTLDELLSQGVVQLLQDSLVLLGIIVVMLVLNWKLALATFTLIPVAVLHMKIFKDKTRIMYRDVRKKLASLNATLAEDLAGSRIIQLFNQYNRKRAMFEAINDENFEAGYNQIKLFAWFRPVIFVMHYIAVAIVLWFGGSMIMRNMITIGLLIAFLRYLDRFFEPINNIAEKFNILQGAMSGAERIFDLFETPSQEYRENLDKGVRINGEIELKHVWLSYHDNDEYALKNVNLHIRKGEKVALVGHTGSGKTSIVSLITDMYPFQKGEMLIDGKPLHSYGLNDLRRSVGIVQQDVFLFSGKIRDNITLNNPDIDDERMKKVCGYVNVAPFIENLPGQYDEPVMERGATFSVGQRQLISFARVLAYDPAIFILDEATSNIDTETEIIIQDALAKVMEGRTSIVIAHRLSTIKHADRIIVLHKGEIAEQGSHDELLARGGLYYDLYRLQFQQFDRV